VWEVNCDFMNVGVNSNLSIVNFETLIIDRGKGNGVVIISLDEYNSLKATQHELSSKLNETRLDSAIIS